MAGTALLLGIAAVLAESRLLYVETVSGAVLREVRLPGPAAAAFAGPDGRIILPAHTGDETFVVTPKGEIERWRGRLFPLVFAEYDRVHAVLPELLLTVSYPERLPVQRVRLAGMTRPWRSACSRDGTLVAVCAQPADRLLVLAAAFPGGRQLDVPLPAEPCALALAPPGGWAAVGLAGSVVAVVFVGEGRPRPGEPVEGEVRALAATPDGKHVVVGTANGRKGALITFRVNPKSETGVRSPEVVPLAAPVDFLQVGAEEVVVVAGGDLLVLARHGRKLAHKVPIGDARQVTMLPAVPATTLPVWSEGDATPAIPPG